MQFTARSISKLFIIDFIVLIGDRAVRGMYLLSVFDTTPLTRCNSRSRYRKIHNIQVLRVYGVFLDIDVLQRAHTEELVHPSLPLCRDFLKYAHALVHKTVRVALHNNVNTKLSRASSSPSLKGNQYALSHNHAQTFWRLVPQDQCFPVVGLWKCALDSLLNRVSPLIIRALLGIPYLYLCGSRAAGSSFWLRWTSEQQMPILSQMYEWSSLNDWTLTANLIFRLTVSRISQRRAVWIVMCNFEDTANVVLSP